MKFDKPITRRELIGKLLRWSGYVTFAGAAQWSLYPLPDAWGANKGFMIEGFGQQMALP